MKIRPTLFPVAVLLLPARSIWLYRQSLAEQWRGKMCPEVFKRISFPTLVIVKKD